MGNRQFLQGWHAASAAALALMLCWQTASADWSTAGAQYSCSTKTGTFTLLPHDQSSADEHPPLETGFKALPDGESNLKCRLGRRTLEALVDVTPPRAMACAWAAEPSV